MSKASSKADSKYQELFRCRAILLCQMQSFGIHRLRPASGETWSTTPALKLMTVFPDEQGHLKRFCRTFSFRRSVSDVLELFSLPASFPVEFLSMHLCFSLKTALRKFDKAWTEDPSKAETVLKRCNREGVMIPVNALLELAYPECVRKGKRQKTELD